MSPTTRPFCGDESKHDKAQIKSSHLKKNLETCIQSCIVNKEHCGTQYSLRPIVINGLSAACSIRFW